MDCCTYDWRCIDKRCVCFCCRSEKNAFSVEVRITSDAVALLGMLSVRNAEKQETSPGFVSRSLLARRVRTSRLHFCLSITSLPLSEPQLAYNLLLLTLKYRDFPARALLDTGASDSYVDSEVAKKLGLECKGQSSSIALASTASLAKVSGDVNCNISAFKDRTALN